MNFCLLLLLLLLFCLLCKINSISGPDNINLIIIIFRFLIETGKRILETTKIQIQVQSMKEQKKTQLEATVHTWTWSRPR